MEDGTAVPMMIRQRALMIKVRYILNNYRQRAAGCF